MKHTSENCKRGFESTRWSLVFIAANADNSDRNDALRQLCELYWFPIYSYARRRGRSQHDAEDLTQAFFTKLLEKNWIAAATPQRGRFRNFLLTSFTNFMANEWQKKTAKKRGGAHTMLQLDFESSEQAYGQLQKDLTAEQLFDRQWVVTLLDRVMKLLRSEYHSRGQEEQFQALKQFLPGRSKYAKCREVADHLGMTESAAMSAVSRMRRRYKAVLTQEISHTVSEHSGIEDEIRALFRTFEA